MRNTSAFTLTEILVSLGIVSVLSALLFTSVNNVKLSAEKARSTTRLKNIVQAAISYGADNNGVIICGFEEGVQGTWKFVLTSDGYLPGTSKTCLELGCEAQKKQFKTQVNATFNWNGRIGNYSSPVGATRFVQLDKPSKVALVMHGIGTGMGSDAGFSRGIYESRYAGEVKPVFGGRVLVGFCAGNVELVKPADIPTSVTSSEGKLFWLGK